MKPLKNFKLNKMEKNKKELLDKSYDLERKLILCQTELNTYKNNASSLSYEISELRNEVKKQKSLRDLYAKIVQIHLNEIF